jgi:glycosyltransferase involved in cell wall biosynthesis
VKVSIITVVLNNKETIKDAILSTGSQDYNNIEHIIIDGGSTDGTQSIIDRYKDRRTIFISERDNGIYEAMNKGLRIACGDIIGFLNSDDLYANEKVISEVVATLKKKKVDAVFGDLVLVAPQNPYNIVRYYQSKNFSPKTLTKGIMPAHPTLYLRKSVYEAYGYFKTDYIIAADFEFVTRIFKDNHISYYYIPKIMIKMRAGGASTKNLKSNWILNLEILRACRENGLRTNLFKIYSKYPRKILNSIKTQRTIKAHLDLL